MDALFGQMSTRLSIRADRPLKLVHLTNTQWEDALKKDQAKVKELEEKFNTKILENGISGRIRSEGGSKPGEIIIRMAEEENATMIVMGTRGLGKVRRTIMGSSTGPIQQMLGIHFHAPRLASYLGNSE
ncbi:hypothetical protein CAPTEDRAFT_221182 [Capitella teleta]|uniref:UspA domain-containing protein n=1 Tax=Capitella teleta TaxID=283909 RepID=R7T4W5_CAPTE|nr:hypothetical protein CAPTEDRAFT_221182 [Capitella teleta]|eukprot:ELT88137.1 hypothetical protein CAPTEDRAFT_221182 [Capitella teleta]